MNVNLSTVKTKLRREMLSTYCSYVEIGNHYWEYEDNCVLNSGIDIDILYRSLDDFCKGIESVVVQCQPANAYTTCMWHNLLQCKILYDRDGRLKAAKEKYDVPFPSKLKQAIVERQLNLMDAAMPAYRMQIEKAVRRRDLVSINHRVTEFLASYFDLLFAFNGITHPGEKRLMELCRKNCVILPENFEENLQTLFSHMYANEEDQLKTIDDIQKIIENVRKIL